MHTICVTNPTKRSTYQVTGPIHETDYVWCGTAENEKYGKCFVKLLHYGKMIPQEQRLALTWAEKEAEIMLSITECTDRTPKLYDHWNDRKNGTYVLVMEQLPGITLDKWMKTHSLSKKDETTLFVRSLLVRQLAQILADIHSNIPGISHRDLKPQNVMISKDEQNHWQVRLIDFGTAGQNFSVGGGTTGYQAPEQLSLEGTIPGTGAAKDMFALGIIWCQLLSGQSADDIRWAFIQDFDAPRWAETPTLPDWVNACQLGPHYQELFQSMTDFNPKKRPAFHDVVLSIPKRRKRP